MKIEIEYIQTENIDKFADRYNLVMKVIERNLLLGCGDSQRFFAHFKDVKVIKDGSFANDVGYGATPEGAIEDYASRISLARIALTTSEPCKHRYIEVPQLLGLSSNSPLKKEKVKYLINHERKILNSDLYNIILEK